MGLRSQNSQLTFATSHIGNHIAGGAFPHGYIVAVPINAFQQPVEGPDRECQPLGRYGKPHAQELTMQIVFLQIFGAVQNVLDPGQKIRSLLRQLNALVAAIENRNVQLRLRILDCQRQGGLGNKQRLGRLRVGAVPGDLGDIVHLLEGHGNTSFY